MPILKWSRDHLPDVEAMLQRNGLGHVPFVDVDVPVSASDCLNFVHELMAREGPDVACRVVKDTSFAELGTFGRFALETETPHEALRRASKLAPFHSSHEVFSVTETAQSVVFHELFMLKVDDETQHFIHQYVTALVRCLCRLACPHGTHFLGVEMIPHPRFGFSHLEPWFGHIKPSRRVLKIYIPRTVADHPFLRRVRKLQPLPTPDDWTSLHMEGSFLAGARIVLGDMLEAGVPTVQRFATAAGMSVRGLQRRLETEGTTFSALLQDVRRDIALDKLQSDPIRIGEISAILGYASQSGLTRAVRRWTGTTPRQMRTQQQDTSCRAPASDLAAVAAQGSGGKRSD